VQASSPPAGWSAQAAAKLLTAGPGPGGALPVRAALTTASKRSLAAGLSSCVSARLSATRWKPCAEAAEGARMFATDVLTASEA
jgi:hypothetical protein